MKRIDDYFILKPKNIIQRILWLVFVPAYKFDNFLTEDVLHVFVNKVSAYTTFLSLSFFIYKTEKYETIVFAPDSSDKLNKVLFKKYFFSVCKNENFIEKVLLTFFVLLFLFSLTFGSVKYLFGYIILSKLYKAIFIFIASFVNLTIPLFLIDSVGSAIANLLVKNLYYLFGILFLVVDILFIYNLF